MRGKRSIGIGYVMIPTGGTSFSEYIQTCHKTKTVSIITEDSEIYHQVRVGSGLFPQIKFPNQVQKEITGSIVIYIRSKDTSIPTIVSVLELSDEGDYLLPEQWCITSKTNSSSTSLVQGDTREGSLDIITSSQTKSSSINIRASSKFKDSSIRIESDGEVLVSADSIHKVTAGEKIQLGEDDLTEPSLLGEKWKTFMEELITTLQGLTVMIPNGAVAGGVATFATPGSIDLLSQKKIGDLSSKLDEVLSTLVEIQ